MTGAKIRNFTRKILRQKNIGDHPYDDPRRSPANAPKFRTDRPTIKKALRL